jgi:threonine dehydrogenase-like Zn-dependent dehydrogenase
MSQRQQIRIHGPGDCRRDMVPLPTVGDADVLVRVHACGICGTDLGYMERGGLGGGRGLPMPLGHEIAGVIEATGSRVRDVVAGQRVIVNPDDDAIGNGGPEGGFSEWVLVRNARLGGNLLAIPGGLGDEAAALVEPLAVAVHGVKRSGLGPGDKAVVLGAGVIGLGAVVGLRHRGVTDIVAIDVHERRLEAARRLGASATIDPSREDLAARLGELHGRQMRYGFPMVGSDAFIDAAGAPALLQQALGLARTRARIVVIAVHKSAVPVDMLLVMAKELELVGSIAYPEGEFDEAVDILSRDSSVADTLISHRFAFTDFDQAIVQARNAAETLKVMVRMAT